MVLKMSFRMGLIIIFIAQALSVTVGSTQRGATDLHDRDYAKTLEKWRAGRLEEVNGEDGWTTLIGLFWLKPGQNRFGSDPTNDIVLAGTSAPKFAGSIYLSDGTLRLETNPKIGITNNGTPVSNLELLSDDNGKPTILILGSLKMFVIKRGDQLGLRVKDKQNPTRTNFAGLEYFPVNLKWNLKATFLPYDPPKSIPIINVLGMVENMTSPGALAFEVDGVQHRLDPVLEKGSNQFFIIFADKTSGKETYGAGRYLYADPPGADGKVTLDFNKSHNPSCAFTRFATCPLPPKQNRLNVRVDAGEKKYAGGEH